MPKEPSVTDSPPDAVRTDLRLLNAALDATIPVKQEKKNLLVATWNLRNFASLTRKWTSEADDSPKRDLRGLRTICDVVSRFDVIAIQEVQGDLRALRDLVRYLGNDWGFLMTDMNLGAAGNKERMAFVYDCRRLKPSGLACELVVPPEWLSEVGEDALRRQFARTPYAVSFKAQNTTFVLVTLHIVYGTDEDPSARVPELKAIGRWMADWARRTSDWEQNFIALGDFNIDRKGDRLWQAFTSTGLTVPDDLQDVPRTIFSVKGNPDTNKHYDQIAWFQELSGVPYLSMQCTKSGCFDFLPYAYTDQGLTKNAISYRISDHYPLWACFLLS